jgi:dUTPase
MKKIISVEVIGIQPVFSTNVENNLNYISEGNIINKNCVVDESYQNEVHINLVNTGSSNVEINAGDKIIQGILLPVNYASVEEVKTEQELFNGEVTERGLGGFGSSGTK